jgi:26S proteasome regulatory subunit N1
MGKGTLTLNPFNSNRTLYAIPSVCGLFTVLVTLLDSKTFMFGKSHYLLYHLLLSISPRLLMTLDKDLAPVSVSCRVGQAVDVVGQAGRPKTITGFQTHSTPVLLGYSERSELASEEYKSLSAVLEGFVILVKNPEVMVYNFSGMRKIKNS